MLPVFIKKGEIMITKKMIKDGITEGVIQFVTDPDFENGGTVCQIEDNWFYLV